MWKETIRKYWLKIGLILMVFLYFVFNYPSFYPFPEITSKLVAKTLTIVGMDVTPYKNMLVADNFPAIEVSAECSGIILLLIFPLIIFLIPYIPLSHRFAALLFIPILFLGNIIRIAIDVFIGFHYSPEMLIFFHNTVGQVFIFFWAISLYVIWLKIFGNFPKESEEVVGMGN